MSQTLWATIMPFGPVTLNILLAQEFFFWPIQRLALISGTANVKIPKTTRGHD